MTETAERREPLTQVLRDMRGFAVLWVGRLVSGIGSGLTGFALPVWVFQQTGSAEAMGLLYFAALAPGVLIAPVAGVLVDRWDRRRVLIASDIFGGVVTVAIALLIFTGRFEIWHLIVISALGSAVGSFQQPAFQAALGALVPKRHFTRAAGLLQTSAAATGILTPLVAGVLVATVGLGGVLIIDFATFLIAVTTLALVRIPRPAQAAPLPGRSLLADAWEGWAFVRNRPGLFHLLMYFPVVNLAAGMMVPLVAPMVLSFSTPVEYGALVGIASAGSLLGGIVLSVWGGPRRRLRALVVGQLLSCVCVALMGLRPSLALVGFAFFLSTVLGTVGQACSQSIWLSKTPQGMMGRVFATRRMLAMSTMPLAALAAGPLAERVFNPLLMPGGALADTVGRVLGTGPGRGIGLLYLILAAYMFTLTLFLAAHPRVRRLEEEIPDAASDAPARPAGEEPGGAADPRPAPAAV